MIEDNNYYKIGFWSGGEDNVNYPTPVITLEEHNIDFIDKIYF